MTSTIAVLEALGSFFIGVAGRVGVFLAAALVLAIPALVGALTWRALERRRRSGTELHPGARLAPNHTWLTPRDDGTLEVGVDEVAERLLPSATAVELPRPGMAVHKGDPIAVIRAGKRAVRIGAPVDGTVMRVNRRLRGNPALVKSEPYGRGWLFALAPAGDEWKALPDGLLADTWLLGEKRRLSRFLEEELGLAAADGGELVAPAPSLLGEAGWKKVVAAFLHAA